MKITEAYDMGQISSDNTEWVSLKARYRDENHSSDAAIEFIVHPDRAHLFPVGKKIVVKVGEA